MNFIDMTRGKSTDKSVHTNRHIKAILSCSLQVSISLAVVLISVSSASADSGLSAALHNAHIFPPSSGARVNLIDRQAVVEVFHNSGDSLSRRKAAIYAARALVNYAPAQMNTVSVKFFTNSGGSTYTEVIVNNRDITSLSVGTIKIDDLANQVSEVDIVAGDNQVSIFNKYLGAAEKQIDQGHYWEAEQIVDSASRTHGTPADASGRFTKDMISLADGFDTWGDPERAERVLRKIVEHRENTNSLTDSDADRSIQHLVDLLLDGKRYQEAEDLLAKLMTNPSLSKTSNPQAYAANLERLALCHIATGKYQQAESELNEVVGWKESSGVGATSLAKTYEGLGDLYRSQGKKPESQSYYRRAKAIYDHAVVSRKASEQIDYQVYNAHLRKIDDKLKQQ